MAIPDPTRKPNFVIIFVDDMGYADIGCFGAKKKNTPHLDLMATEGRRFTDFYVSASVCTPSRASLMTGCYPMRIGMQESATSPFVFVPREKKGLNTNEKTMAKTLKEQGYATACIGKWHLGDQPEFMPRQHGFDYYFGVPYSNDMCKKKKNPENSTPLPLLRNEDVIELEPDQDYLTRRFTEEATSFIKEHRDEPFFVYVPHVMPHVPLHASEPFRGRSEHGKYSDAIEELDWSAGEILKTLKDLDLDDNTCVIFTSDNGGVRRLSEMQPLYGGKASIWEGGFRVPCIMCWPERIPAGTTCTEITTSMDLLPTITGLVNGELPENPIDGKDISSLIFSDADNATPHEAFFYYYISQLRAVRSGKWKLHLACDPMITTWTGSVLDKCDAALYNLETDIAERNNVIDDHPDVAARLTKLARQAQAELGDYKVQGSGYRTPGWCDNPGYLWDGTDLEVGEIVH